MNENVNFGGGANSTDTATATTTRDLLHLPVSFSVFPLSWVLAQIWGRGMRQSYWSKRCMQFVKNLLRPEKIPMGLGYLNCWYHYREPCYTGLGWAYVQCPENCCPAGGSDDWPQPCRNGTSAPEQAFKSSTTKSVDLVESYNFHIKFTSIWVRTEELFF
jgi:hypothetical protein